MKPILRVVLLCAALHSPAWAAAFDLQGHRGARGLMPENTLPAFALALSLGVTTLEMDIAITQDGHLVVSHDPVLNPNIVRGPDGKYVTTGQAINTLTLAQIRSLDVGRIQPGTRYAASFAQQQAVDGTRMPLLTEVFALVKKAGNTQVRFDIETKISPLKPFETLPPAEFARALIAVIRGSGMATRATIQSFDWRSLQVVQKEAPEIPTVYLTAQQPFLDNVGAASPEPSLWTAGFRYAEHGSVPKLIHAAGGRIWAPYFGDLDAMQLAQAKALGLTVVPWTVNTPADMTRLMDMGVDGLISDRPDLVREEMKRRGMPLPLATPVTP